MIGKTLGHYQITEKIGEGGMGVVCKARDTHLDRLVAIKVLPPERVSDQERKRRFIQEAKSASALNHPSIITIYDIDQADGVDFIAMEYVGESRDFAVFEDGIYYGGRYENGKTPLLFYQFSAGTSRLLFRAEGYVLNGLTVSRDRKTVLFSTTVTGGSDLMLIENFR